MFKDDQLGTGPQLQLSSRAHSVVRLPVHRDELASDVHLVDIHRHKRNHALSSGGRSITLGSQDVLDAQHRLRASGHQVAHTAQRHAFAVHHIQADQVDPVVLVGGCGRKAASRQKNSGTAQGFGGRAVVHATELGNH